MSSVAWFLITTLSFFHLLLTILSTSAKLAFSLFLTVLGLLLMPGFLHLELPPLGCSNYCTIALISHASKIMLKILQARLQQYVNCELPDVQASFRKGRGAREIANIWWIIEKVKEFQKNIYFFFIAYAKAFVWITVNCGRVLKRWGYQIVWPTSWEICMQDRKQQLELDIKQWPVPNRKRSTSRLYIVTLLI